MKLYLREQITESESDKLIDVTLFCDQEITKGLFIAASIKNVKSNVKNLNIKYQIPENKNETGIKFSKHKDFIALTIVSFDNYGIRNNIQFIIKKHCTIDNVVTCNHFSIVGVKSVINEAIKILHTETLSDLLDAMKGQDL